MNRIKSFDNIRAFSVLWIVGFWHMIGYWNADYKLSEASDAVCQIITWTILCSFTYLSGYFLGSKKVLSIHDLYLFYKARLKRFYFLFSTSCITLFVAGILLKQKGLGNLWFPENSDFLFSLLGISTYIGNPPATIWYFCMLMSFYIITPLFLIKDNLKYKIIIGTIIYLILIYFYLFEGIDKRNIIYFPFYFLGIVKFIKPRIVKNRILIIELLLYGIAIGLQYKFGISDSIIIIIIQSIIGIFLFTHFFEKYTYFFDKITILTIISYSSMSAYLFHRQICGVLKILLNSNWITPYTTSLFFIPFIFLISYYIQKKYDQLIK